jgi:Domain of Unknown Function (DUF930)
MTRFGLALVIFFMTSAASFAADARTTASLHRLDSATRFDQVCDIEAMSRIKSGTNLFHPDRAITYAICSTKVTVISWKVRGEHFAAGVNGTSFHSHAVLRLIG